MGGPNTCSTKFKMADCWHFVEVKKLLFYHSGLTDFHEIWHDNAKL